MHIEKKMYCTVYKVYKLENKFLTEEMYHKWNIIKKLSHESHRTGKLSSV